MSGKTLENFIHKDHRRNVESLECIHYSDDQKTTLVEMLMELELGSDVLSEPQYTTAETERYEDLGVLSERGGLSTVCKAKDRSTGSMVAAKLHDNRADFEKELANLKRAQEGGAGDHVVPLLDSDETKRILFLELAEVRSPGIGPIGVLSGRGQYSQ